MRRVRRRGDAGHVVRDREREHRARDRDGGGHRDRPEGDAAVDRLRSGSSWKFFERRLVHDLGRERVELPERGDEHDRERAEVADDEPSHRPRQERTESHARMPVQVRRELPARPRAPGVALIGSVVLTRPRPASRVGRGEPAETGSPAPGRCLAAYLGPGLRPLGVVLADLSAVVAAVRDGVFQ